ncbi:metal ABC transporter permease [Rhodopirellula sallentina]|uniref:Manganese ABC transporter permease protein n=1 Tax=Rhodopirellula sallentina SM41 TaxID=1263870 RepID=M5TZ87_9BACT|nr:metal ABC transporter permease [Rhodopirellula sallentina]EMI54334.1 manganese ABC transporter permease protein [Rhodopirellula sallentina SM41]
MMGFDWNWQLDGWIVAAGILCAVASSLLGCFLLLRRMSLLGDAISHAVLPGLAAAFLISGSRSSIWMFVGAVIVGVLTALLSDFIHNRGQVDEGASMGVVFTTLFASGLLMIVVAADRVDLDPGCVLYGAIEQTPLDKWDVPWLNVAVPRVVVVLSIVTIINVLFVGLFFKELKISTFDAALATASGFSASLIHYALMTLVAITAVASFESVGNILVVAMLIVPPATAYLLTNRLGTMVILSCIIAAASAWAGHVMAIVIPSWFGFRSTTTAGMMSVAAGAAFLLAFLFAPQQGFLPRWARQQWLRWTILADDVLTLLYRIEESSRDTSADKGGTHSGEIAKAFAVTLAPSKQTIDWVAETLLTNRFAVKLAIRYLTWRGRVEPAGASDSVSDASQLPTASLPKLTRLGRREAKTIVRSHRLWEQYLVTKVDVAEERLHAKADRLEHFTDREMQDQLDEQTDSPATDPHGRPIPHPDQGTP